MPDLLTLAADVDHDTETGILLIAIIAIWLILRSPR